MEVTKNKLLKKCNKCSVLKGLQEFSKKSTNKGRKTNKRLTSTNYICRSCDKERNKQNYLKRVLKCKSCTVDKTVLSLETGRRKFICKTCQPELYKKYCSNESDTDTDNSVSNN